MQSRNVVPGVPNTPWNAIEAFQEVDPYFPERNLMITGITKDSTGAVLGGCVVKMVNAQTEILQDTEISDGNGNYNCPIPKGLSQQQTTTWQIKAYKAGSPDVAGITRNDLVGS